jgi:hypothetical protein
MAIAKAFFCFWGNGINWIIAHVWIPE